MSPDFSDLESELQKLRSELQAKAEQRIIGRVVTWDAWERTGRYGPKQKVLKRGVVRKVSIWSGRISLFVQPFRKDNLGFLSVEEKYEMPSKYTLTEGHYFTDDDLED